MVFGEGQHVNHTFPQEVLEPLAPLEESDTSSLFIIEAPAETLPAPGRLPSTPDHEEPSPSGSHEEEERPAPNQRAEPSPVVTETSERQATPLLAVSDYTTMELFQQTMAQPPARAQPLGEQAQPSSAQGRPVQDYIRQATCLLYPSDSDGLTDKLRFSAL